MTDEKSADGDIPGNEERRKIRNHEEFFDSRFKETPIRVSPGEFECTDDPYRMLVSDAGSGVVICIHDQELKFGGMCHVLLPEQVIRAFPHLENIGDEMLEKADRLIESFIRSLKRKGAGKNRIRIKLFGGTTMMEDTLDTGLKNYVFAKEYFMQKGLNIASEDIGGDVCRRIYFFTSTGKTERCRLMRKADMKRLADQEKAFISPFGR